MAGNGMDIREEIREILAVLVVYSYRILESSTRPEKYIPDDINLTIDQILAIRVEEDGGTICRDWIGETQ